MAFTETEERNWICTHFDTMMQIGSPEAKKDYILKHPLLLTLNIIPILKEERGKHPDALSGIDYLDHLRTNYWNQTEDYPIGIGPIEQIVDLLRDGDIEFEDAKQRIKDINCAGLLSPLYIRALMLSWIDDLNIDLNFTMTSAELAVEAVIANPLPSLSISLMMQVTEGYVRLAHGSLLKRPDGKIFSRALKLGQWAVKVANSSERYELESEFLHSLGTLVLDAYAANFAPSKAYAENIDIWIERAVNPMPPVEEGLKLAKLFLEDAFPNRANGAPFGETIKALMETIIYESFYREREPNIEGLRQLSLKAKEHLDPTIDAAQIERIDQLMGLYL